MRLMRLGSTLLVCGLAGQLAGPVLARPQTAAPPRSPSVTEQYVFPSGAGVLFFHVRPDRTADFEAVVTLLGEALDRSADPVRRQQASNWRVYRSAEASRDVVIYLFFFAPAVFGADYDPIKVLGEDTPADVAGLYERLRADLVRVERMGLTTLR